MASLLAGVYAAYFFPEGFPAALLFGVLFILFIALFFTKKSRLLFCMAAFLLFGAFHLQQVHDVTRQALYPYLNEYVTISAEVIREPVSDEEDGSSYLLARVRHISFLQEEAGMKETVRLTFAAGEMLPHFGESFTAVCRLSAPQESLNRGGFDYALYLKSQEIFFQGTVEEGTVAVTGKFPLSFSERIYQFNQACSRVLSNSFPREEAAVFQAMALGDKSNMPEALSEQLRVSGLSHMTAVSGMHVTILVSLIYALLMLFGQNKRKYIWLVGGLVLLFMVFTGATPSVVRAAVMGVLTLTAEALRRKADSLTSLAAAAGVIVFCNPAAAFDTGFMLSFGATLGILLFAEPLNRWLCQAAVFKKQTLFSKLLRSGVAVFCVTLGAQLLILPIASWLFGELSVWGFISGMLAAPLAPFILAGGLTVSLLGLIHPLAAVLPAGFFYPFVKLFLCIVHGFGTLRSGLITLASFSAFGLYCYLLVLFALHGFLHKKRKSCFIPAVSFAVLFCVYLAAMGLGGEAAKVTFINVGQGDCTLLQLPQDIDILIDAGGTPDYAGDFDVGNQIVLPYLHKAGIRELDYMIASHAHSDHLGGLEALLDTIRVETVLVPPGFERSSSGKRFLSKAAEKGAQVKTFSAGDSISFSENCVLKALMPDLAWTEWVENENDASLVLWFRFFETTALFPGDIEEEAEEKLVTMETLPGGAQIVKAAHHGSASGTGEAFLNWAAPFYVYIPCGKNSFGHPADSVLDRLAFRNITVYRADRDKDVSFVLGEHGIRTIRTGGQDK